MKNLEVEKVSSLILSNAENDVKVDDETGGLIFYDPKAEARRNKEVEVEEAQRNRQNLCKEQGNAASSMMAQQVGNK